MLIREVILENFMSYEYARVPLRDGVNIVCGPNGSGKSSLLLGICVALGDTYTERSKKLSDLIRWESDRARVTLILDNSIKDNGYRPISRVDMDEITLSRTLRRSGQYSFALNQKGVTKAEVVDLLKGFGFDPNNMLIIMHQNMPGRFANIKASERMEILEEAVGYESFRQDVIIAKKKLSGILSEEESLNQLLNQARETLAYWREQNERLQEKKQLHTRQNFLQRESAWSKVLGFELIVMDLQQDLNLVDEELAEAEAEMELNTKKVIDSEDSLRLLNAQWIDIIEKRIDFERIVGVTDNSIRISKEQIEYLDKLLSSNSEEKKRFERSASTLRSKLNNGPTRLDDYFPLFNEMEKIQSEIYDLRTQGFLGQKRGIDSRISDLTTKLLEAEQHSSNLSNQMESIKKSLDLINNQYIESRIQLALLKDKRVRLKRHIEALKSELNRSNKNLKDAEAEAIINGPRIETGRTSDEILAEIRRTAGMLMGMANVPDEAEEMYENYSHTFQEIKERIEQIKESRRQVMEEIEERTKKWHEVTETLLTEVNNKYKILLSKLQATGEVRLINSQDIEEAGLEIYVGFKGAQPSKLDPYTHSGGERSTSVMAFLLALQQNVISPFRAVDEFDLHMDPRNKEVVSDFIVSSVKGTQGQYMAITPSQITFKDKDVHIVMVHKTETVSIPRIVEDT
jgi:chromosome segregation protein